MKKSVTHFIDTDAADDGGDGYAACGLDVVSAGNWTNKIHKVTCKRCCRVWDKNEKAYTEGRLTKGSLTISATASSVRLEEIK